MPTFTAGETKIRPGEYHRIQNAGGLPTAGARNGIIAGIVSANWGPLNKAVTLDPNTDVGTIFGNGNTVDLIPEMFKEGATRGYFVRVGTGGTAGTLTLKNSDEETDAITITANYVGDRAITVSIRDSLTNTSERECIIYDGTAVFETIKFAKGAEGGEAAALAAAFASSKNFTAQSKTDSGALKAVTQEALTKGANPTVNTQAYSAALAALEPYAWNVLCVDSEDPAVHALVLAFLQRVYAGGAYPMAVLSEKSASGDLDARMKKAAAFNDAKVIYVLNGGEDNAGNIHEGYINAARIGGIVAAVPANQSVTHYVVSGYADLAERLTNTEVEQALLSGCIVLTVNSSGQVWIEQGINTLITPSGDEDDGWKKIRRAKTRFELMQRIGDTVAPLIGKVNNDTDGRAAIIAAAQSVVNQMAAEKKIQAGGSVYEDPANPAKGDSAWFIIAIDDIDSIEKIYITYRFRFSPSD